MPWFKVDDELHDHPKVRQAPIAAIGLWVCAGSWCMDKLTDGFVPDYMIRTWATKRQATDLVNVGLWQRENHPTLGDGYQFNDWDEYQPTAETIRLEREAARIRKQKQRAEKAKSQAESLGSPGGSHGGTTDETDSGTHTDVTDSVLDIPDPTHPDLDLNNHHPTEVTTYAPGETSDDDFHSLNNQGVF